MRPVNSRQHRYKSLSADYRSQNRPILVEATILPSVRVVEHRQPR